MEWDGGFDSAPFGRGRSAAKKGSRAKQYDPSGDSSVEDEDVDENSLLIRVHQVTEVPVLSTFQFATIGTAASQYPSAKVNPTIAKSYFQHQRRNSVARHRRRSRPEASAMKSAMVVRRDMDAKHGSKEVERPSDEDDDQPPSPVASGDANGTGMWSSVGLQHAETKSPARHPSRSPLQAASRSPGRSSTMSAVFARRTGQMPVSPARSDGSDGRDVHPSIERSAVLPAVAEALTSGQRGPVSQSQPMASPAHTPPSGDRLVAMTHTQEARMDMAPTLVEENI